MPPWLSNLLGVGQGKTSPDVAAWMKLIDAKLSTLTTKVGKLMASSSEVLELAKATLAAVNEAKDKIGATNEAVAPLPAAVDRMEAAITALKNSGSVPPAVQKDLDDAAAALRDAVTGAVAAAAIAVAATTTASNAAADAADQVDEAAGP